VVVVVVVAVAVVAVIIIIVLELAVKFRTCCIKITDVSDSFGE
jgi:hypothetical protein